MHSMLRWAFEKLKIIVYRQEVLFQSKNCVTLDLDRYNIEC
jgi:hypothetical protein